MNKTSRQRAYNVILSRICATIVEVEMQFATTYSERVSVALFIQHAKRMCRVILPSVACPALPYFSTLLHKR